MATGKGIQPDMSEAPVGEIRPSESRIVSAPRRGFRSWVLVIGGMVLGIVLTAFLAPIALVGGIRTAFGQLHWSRATTVDTSAPSVVDKIRQLNRLESVDYSMDKIVVGDREAPGIPSFLAGDRLLLIAHGEVIAGVDLTQLDAKAVQVDGETVHVRLPAAQVLVTRVDNARTRVYERSTGLLVPPDPNLESQARLAAEKQITQAALDDGILDKARQNAKVSVTGLLYALGFHHVDVQ